MKSCLKHICFHTLSRDLRDFLVGIDITISVLFVCIFVVHIVPASISVMYSEGGGGGHNNTIQYNTISMSHY